MTIASSCSYEKLRNGKFVQKTAIPKIRQHLSLCKIHQFTQQLFIFLFYKPSLHSQTRIREVLPDIVFHLLCPHPLLSLLEKPLDPLLPRLRTVNPNIFLLRLSLRINRRQPRRHRSSVCPSLPFRAHLPPTCPSEVSVSELTSMTTSPASSSISIDCVRSSYPCRSPPVPRKCEDPR